MHLRGASSLRRSGLTRHHVRRALRAPILLLPVACLAVVACAGASPPADGITIDLTLTPSPPVAGAPAVARLALRDGRGRLLRGVTVRVAAHMTHPGMAPVVATAAERADGTQELPLEFTMAGDWIVHVTGTLADGRPIDRWIEVEGVRAAE